jgi:hypothetical protein
MNMVGTCQTDRTGAGALGKVAVKAKEIVIGSHDDKILESLASGTSAVASRYLNTTGSCNQASHTTSHIIHLVRNIAYPNE